MMGRPSGDDDPPPPIGGSWKRLYGLVIAFLLFQVVVYWLLTRLAS